MISRRHTSERSCRKLYDPAVRVRPTDLTARAKIRRAALELFARDGYDRVAMRSIAARAGVSPSLVVHHFGTKARLRGAVDDAVVSEFHEALGTVDLSGGTDDVVGRISAAITSVIADDPPTWGYLKRVLTDDGATGQRCFDVLVDLVARGLAELRDDGLLRPDTDIMWSAYAVVFVILGPTVHHGRLVHSLGSDPFEPSAIRARSAANAELIHSGIFAGGRRGPSRGADGGGRS